VLWEAAERFYAKDFEKHDSVRLYYDPHLQTEADIFNLTNFQFFFFL